MIDRDYSTIRRNNPARKALANLMAVLGGNDNPYTAAPGRRSAAWRRAKVYSHGELGGIPILESDVLILDCGAGRTDGFGVAGLVVPVTCGGVFGGDGKASRVARDLEAVAAVGADSDFLCGIDGRPYPGRGNDAALRGVGGFGWGDYGTLYGGGVGGSRFAATTAGRGTGGEQCRHRQEWY